MAEKSLLVSRPMQVMVYIGMCVWTIVFLDFFEKYLCSKISKEMFFLQFFLFEIFDFFEIFGFFWNFWFFLKFLVFIEIFDFFRILTTFDKAIVHEQQNLLHQKIRSSQHRWAAHHLVVQNIQYSTKIRV